MRSRNPLAPETFRFHSEPDASRAFCDALVSSFLQKALKFHPMSKAKKPEVPASVCGAKKRDKTPCQSRPVKGRKRCRMHGGKTPRGIASPNLKTGKYSKLAWLPDPVRQRATQLEVKLLDNIEQNIQLLATLETQYHEKLGSSESTAAWEKLRGAVSEYAAAEFIDDKPAQAMARAKAFGMIRWIVEEGLSQSFLVRDIMQIQESQRKQTETLHKCRKADEQVITMDDYKQLVMVVLMAVRNEITDRASLDRIQTAITKPIELGADAIG